MNTKSYMRTAVVALLTAFAFFAESSAKVQAVELEIKPEDRVIFLGGTFVERMQYSGFLEATLVATDTKGNQTFRNLGWSGDTPWGHARAVFGGQPDGYKRLVKDTEEAKPTLIVYAYGNNAAFDGKEAIAAFLQQYESLINDLQKRTRARAALILPREYDSLGGQLPDQTKYNAVVREFRTAIRELAKAKDIPVLDPDADNVVRKLQLTENGVHLTDRGYWHTAVTLAKQMGRGSSIDWRVELGAGSPIGENTDLTDVVSSADGASFVALDRVLPMPPCPGGSSEHESVGKLVVKGLDPGDYVLRIDGVKNVAASAQQWASGVSLASRGGSQQAHQLRSSLSGKNELFFYRYRPQNETYLFLFRKHEQGNNAGEIPQFDPLIENKEREIAVLRVPIKHKYQLRKATN
ncbi:MAG: lysophospholipase L1-like esterase [Pirellulaceae bacterium]|jgi:lysophospholipase L1-like esterase